MRSARLRTRVNEGGHGEGSANKADEPNTVSGLTQAASKFSSNCAKCLSDVVMFHLVKPVTGVTIHQGLEQGFDRFE